MTPEPSRPATLPLAEIFEDTWSKNPFEEQHNEAQRGDMSFPGSQVSGRLGTHLAFCHASLVLVPTEFLLAQQPYRGAVPCQAHKNMARTLVEGHTSCLYFSCSFEQFWEAGDLSFGGLTPQGPTREPLVLDPAGGKGYLFEPPQPGPKN